MDGFSKVAIAVLSIGTLILWLSMLALGVTKIRIQFNPDIQKNHESSWDYIRDPKSLSCYRTYNNQIVEEVNFLICKKINHE